MEFNPFGMSPALIAAMATTAAVAVVAPVVAAFVALKKFDGGVKYVAIGALTFFVFQLLTRVPLVTVAGLGLQESLEASVVLQWVWLGGVALSAGLFEEGGRWVAFRYGFGEDERTWDKAVLMGIGHGGIESMLLVGLSVGATLGVMLFMPIEMLGTDPEGIAALEKVAQQTWWVGLLGGFERLMAMLLHVALSVIVFQVWARGGVKWLLGAIAFHTVANFGVVGLMKVVGAAADPELAALASEGAMLIVGIISVVIVARTRPSEVD